MIESVWHHRNMTNSEVLSNKPVTTPCLLGLFWRALVRTGRPLTVTETKPILRKVLQVRPTAVTVALDSRLVIKL
jgi:hypothetical protein